ncbi:putative MFS transmembrane transport protein [Wallemia mellicola]|nr:putative MFS transmembrane transport protein [Wallemia mellicola]
MPILKKTGIRSTFFPDGSNQQQVEGAEHEQREDATSSEGKNEDGNIILIAFEENDPENPLNWGKGRKWLTTSLLNAMTMIIGLSTSAYSPTTDAIAEDLGVSSEAALVGMFTFNAACSVGPLFLAPFCEMVGRRYVYIGGFFCFTAVFPMLAAGQNIGTMIVGRLLSGLFGCIGTILVGGTLADIWVDEERSVPMSQFTFVAIFSTIAAPAYCGYIVERVGYRWVEWVHMIASGTLLLIELFLFKETRGATVLAQRTKKLRKETGDNRFRAPIELESESIKMLLHKSCTRAFILLAREPVILFFGIWIALSWMLVFMFMTVIPLTFSGNHHWSTGKAGLPYIALMIGCVLGYISGFWSDHMYNKSAEKNGGKPVPEARLYGAMVFAPFFPIGLYIFSFTQYSHVHWIAPTIALVPMIFGIYHVFLAVYNYTSDSYGEYSSSGIAGQGLLRNMAAAASPLFATQMFKGMGYQFAGLFLALLATAIAPLPYILFKYGKTIRAKSKFASATTGLTDETNDAVANAELGNTVQESKE